jgi:hypothetical protein
MGGEDVLQLLATLTVHSKFIREADESRILARWQRRGTAVITVEGNFDPVCTGGNERVSWDHLVLEASQNQMGSLHLGDDWRCNRISDPHFSRRTARVKKPVVTYRSGFLWDQSAKPTGH